MMASKSKPTAAATRASTRTRTTSTTANAPAATTRTTRAKAATITKISTEQPAEKKPPGRKPLVNRDNAIDVADAPLQRTNSKKVLTAKLTKSGSVLDTDREPIKRFSGIPTNPTRLGDEPTSPPYLEPLSDVTVRMTDTLPGASNRTHFRTSVTPHSSLYTFSHVFPPATPQAEFFTRTTLPLVRDLLEGQNALLFTYGVTNSGKTYTVQGGSGEGEAGILPRTLDVIFNSIGDLQSDARYKPVRLHGIEAVEPAARLTLPSLNITSSVSALAEALADNIPSVSDSDVDDTILKVDRNYEYSVWVSYAEVYNEKVFDLLATVNEDRPRANTQPSQNFPSRFNVTRKALQVRPSPAADSSVDTPGKYIDGLRDFRVSNAMEAKALLRLGQLHRTVYGTLANSASSRSHGLFTIKIVRGHKADKDDISALQVSRLTLVDLAGSERTKLTQTSGDRLREAGNINKSLMVLGQCMEVMRANQRRVAQSLAGGTGGNSTARVDTREVKRGLAVIPFRHSKLTEILMDYFVGDGRAVMIVNVNPYDTGYDENSHVMKFAALAREVHTTPAVAPHQRVPASPTKPNTVKKASGGATKGAEPQPYRRKVILSTGGPQSRETLVEVLEEDEDKTLNEDDDDGEPINPLVDALFDEIESLRMQLYESEMRCVMIEAETREEVMLEMEERMHSVERMYTRRLMSEVEQNEMKTDAKIDMLHRSGLFGSPVKGGRSKPSHSTASEEEDEDDVEESLLADESDMMQAVTADEGAASERHDGSESSIDSRSPSPLAGRNKHRDVSTIITPRREIRHSVPAGPEHTPLPYNYSRGEPEAQTETETATATDDEASVTDEYEDDESEEDDGDEDEWVPNSRTVGRVVASSSEPVGLAAKEKKAAPRKVAPPKTLSDPALRPNLQAGRRSKRTNIYLVEQEMKELSLSKEAPRKGNPARTTRRTVASDDESDIEEIKEDLAKKKKRQLGKKAVLTEDQIEKVVEHAAKNDQGRTIKRLTKGSK